MKINAIESRGRIVGLYSASFSNEEPRRSFSKTSEAAVEIQKRVRGFLTRKRVEETGLVVELARSLDDVDASKKGFCFDD